MMTVTSVLLVVSATALVYFCAKWWSDPDWRKPL